MTAAFRHLLDQARIMHRDHAGVAQFVGFPTDLEDQDYTPFDIPAAALLRGDTGATTPFMTRFRDAFVGAGPDAQWRETYKDTDIGVDFMNRFACYCLIGPGAPFVSKTMAGFVVFMPAGLHYTWHHHPAEEMYLVLSGEAEFIRQGEAPETLRAGDTSFHHSNQPHAMTTHDHPVMAYVTWRNHLDIPPVLTPPDRLQSSLG